MNARQKLMTTVASGFVAVLLSAHMALSDSGVRLQACDEICYDECPTNCAEFAGESVTCEPCEGEEGAYAIAKEDV